jgi:hypothetical protein
MISRMRIRELFSECVAAVRHSAQYLVHGYDLLKRIDSMTMHTLAVLFGMRD